MIAENAAISMKKKAATVNWPVVKQAMTSTRERRMPKMAQINAPV
jgi:hypothetical protein